MPEKLHHDKRLEENLKEIYDLEVALEEEHESKRQLLMFLLEAFKDYCFCRCPLFVKYFRHFFLTGSYFEGLRVKEATEFDVNVAFDFPFCKDDYKIDELDMLPSFATIKFKSAVHSIEDVPFFDGKGYVLKNKLLRWFQSLLDSFLNTNKLHYPGVIIMKCSNSGPARTVKVLYKSDWISIDLVPVFYLNLESLKKFKMHLEFCEKTKNVSSCYVVPKPLKTELARYVPHHNSEKVWRVHFPEAEKNILKGKENLKCVIQLAKALRDKEDWPLPSYFLKVIALWLVKLYPKEEFWSKHSLNTLFCLFLESLESHLAAQYLGHLFYPRFNLFCALQKSHLKSLRQRVKKIIRQLKRHPDSAFVFFKVSDCHHCSPLVPSLIRY